MKKINTINIVHSDIFEQAKENRKAIFAKAEKEAEKAKARFRTSQRSIFDGRTKWGKPIKKVAKGGYTIFTYLSILSFVTLIIWGYLG